MRRVILVLLGPFLFSGLMAQQGKAEIRIRKALDSDRPYRALTYCERALSKNDTAAVIHILRADAYNRIGKYKDALRDAKSAANSRREDPERIAQLIGAYIGLGEADSALQCFQGRKDLVRNEDLLFRMGLTHQRLDRWNDALANYEEGVVRFPNSSRMVRERGACHAMLGDSASAHRDLDKAVQLSPHDAVAYNNRGFYRWALFGEHTRAIADMDMAIKQDPNYGFAFCNRGWSRYKLGDREKAVRDLQLAARKNPGNAYVYRHLGYIELESGDTLAACAHFQKALDHGFTKIHGGEVEALIAAHCEGQQRSTPVAPPEFPERPNAPDIVTPRGNAP